MRNLKKFLALVMAMMMTLSLMVTADAATSSKDLNLSDSNAVSAVFLEDIQVLTGMEVIKGYPDGSFKPQVEINRHQMATFIYRMTTGDTKDLKDVYLSEIAAEKFPDVKAEDSYAGYIGYCWVNGYIAGFPDGTFKPMNKVTGYQALVMILRAMGYNNPNDNFTGKDWQSLALSRARMNNLLVNIDKSVYNGTFSRPAPRELVAEMVFQGLIQPQVVYTSAMGYQKYGMEGGVLSSILNPTLGYENFGLTNHKGIIVGNTQTGEPNLPKTGVEGGVPQTKIGFSVDVDISKDLTIGDDNTIGDGTAAGWTVTGNLAGAAINDDISKAAYYYDSALVHNDNGTPVVAVNEYNVTLGFQWESGLKQFNHAVDVWYDCRGAAKETVELEGANVQGSVSFPTNLTTYAVFDRATATTVITSATNDGTGTWTDTPFDGDPANLPLPTGSAIKTKDGVFFNYSFAPNTPDSWGVNGTPATDFAVSPVTINNGINNYVDAAAETNQADTQYPLYLVISNSADKTADVVISLDLTMSKVTQDNNTQAPFTTGIVTENDGVGATGYGYFDLWDQVNPAVGEDYSNIADANRVDSYNAVLGDYVAAVTVTGTAPKHTIAGVLDLGNGIADATAGAGDATPTDGTEGNATPATGMKSSYYYELTKLTKKVTGTMVKFDQDTDTIHLNVNGEIREIARSVFALATDGSFKDAVNVWAPRAAGTYTFYLDENDNWLFWEQGRTTAEFVYGTYMDYTSATASSTFNYPFVYVNAQGEQKQLTDKITEMTLGAPPAVKSINDTEYNNNLRLPKRTNLGGNSAGFVRGQYIGYVMDDDTLTAVTDLPNATGFVQATNTAANGALSDGTTTINYNDFGANGGQTVIDADSVAIGAEPVTGEGKLFLTERTKFVIVDGAGMANQTAKTYDGLTEFLGNYKSVTIDATTAVSGTYLLDNGTDTAIANPYEMIYYSLEEDPYAQDYDQMDKHIATVFIPVEMLDPEEAPVTGNLFFVGDSTYGLIDAPNNATQYTFYQNGEKSVLWITGLTDKNSATDAGNDADTINNLGDNVFYQLRETTRTAVDGGKIYALVAIEDQATADKAIIGQYYGDDGTNTGSLTTVAGETAVMADTHDATGASSTDYLATTRYSQVAYIGGRTASELYNVANTNVLNLNDDYTVNSLADLNDLSSLASNQGVPVSCVLSAAKTVSFIYVNH